MCLLVVASRIDAQTPLIVGANRDERLDRPADTMTVLREHGPRILGGRDELAGGTWLAVNEHGVVASLTNRPNPEGRDPSKRSRGELPVALTSHPTASSAVSDFVERFAPSDFNPAWLFVGDRLSLYSIDFTSGPRAAVEALLPGLHVLENLAYGSYSSKVEHVKELIGPLTAERSSAPVLWSRMAQVLADHTLPVGTQPQSPGVERSGPRDTPVDGPTSESSATKNASETTVSEHGSEAAVTTRRPETLAACVHSEDYGTRCSTLVSVPGDPGTPIRVSVADGHPCTAPFVDRTGLWTAG